MRNLREEVCAFLIRAASLTAVVPKGVCGVAFDSYSSLHQIEHIDKTLESI